MEHTEQTSSTAPQNPQRRNLALLLGLIGGFLMLYLLLGLVTVTNGPPCVQNCPPPLSPQAQEEMLVAIYTYLVTGGGAITASLAVRIVHSRQPIYYGWAMMSLAAVHSLTSVVILELSMPATSVWIASSVVFIGPLLALLSGWMLSTEKLRP